MTINVHITVPLFLVMPMRTELYKSSPLLLLLLLYILYLTSFKVTFASYDLNFNYSTNPKLMNIEASLRPALASNVYDINVHNLPHNC